MTKVVFFLVMATPAWLAMTPAERNATTRKTLGTVLRRHPEVRLRYFDAEAYNARVSDVLMWEVNSEGAYRALVEDLRETPFWGHYFNVREIVMAVEDGFSKHYGVPRVGSGRPTTPDPG
ncbi:MAG: hypothetical protein OXU20_29705 [Myxococcales bacterium]|nr:hypothetical protein [Myxococcales bacterium]MDD9967399.1 hypothetical protein [Myxococcales bacterium]